jgi:FkbM family methyltransferase
MQPRRALIDTADRSFGRKILARLATRYARRGTDLDVEIYYDRAWIHRIGSTHIPVSDRFEYRREWDSVLSSTFDPIEENWFFRYRPAAGHTIVDVGAGDGLDSMVFSRAVGPTGKVLAVEAHPATFVLLEQTCRLNGLQNVTPTHLAVMDRPGSVAIAEEGSHRDFFSVVGAAESSAETKIVTGVTLDDLCHEHELSRVDFLKMNIEGAERYALQGGRELLGRTSHVCIACHDFLADGNPELATKSFVVDLLEGYGFDVTLRDEHPLPWVRDHVHGSRGAHATT